MKKSMREINQQNDHGKVKELAEHKSREVNVISAKKMSYFFSNNSIIFIALLTCYKCFYSKSE